MKTSLLRFLLGCLPPVLADKIYWHLLRGFVRSLPGAFVAAPLRLCPSVFMNLNTSDTAHGHLALVGVYEPELSSIFTKLSSPGGTLVDVGANYGYYSLLWCGLNPNNRSIAFEASPGVLPKLKANIALNRFAERIHLHEMAAADQTGKLHFDIGPPEQTGWGGISKADIGSDIIEVVAVRLDDVFGAEEIRLLKIDCEGADYLVLQGAERLLREKRIHHICFEENVSRMQQLGIEPGIPAQYMRKLGYHCEAFGGGTEFHAWI